MTCNPAGCSLQEMLGQATTQAHYAFIRILRTIVQMIGQIGKQLSQRVSEHSLGTNSMAVPPPPLDLA